MEIARGLSPVSSGYLMAFESQPPPNWCQAHKSGGPGVLAFGVQITRGLSPVSAGNLLAFELQTPPNWCQAHKSGGPGVLAIAVEIARGLSPVSGGYLMAFKCHSCLSPFVDVLGPILCELGGLARNPLQAFPRRPGDPWVSRKDAKTQREMAR